MDEWFSGWMDIPEKNRNTASKTSFCDFSETQRILILSSQTRGSNFLAWKRPPLPWSDMDCVVFLAFWAFFFICYQKCFWAFHLRTGVYMKNFSCWYPRNCLGADYMQIVWTATIHTFLVFLLAVRTVHAMTFRNPHRGWKLLRTGTSTTYIQKTFTNIMSFSESLFGLEICCTFLCDPKSGLGFQ